MSPEAVSETEELVVQTTAQPGSKRELRVEVPASEVGEAVIAAIQHLAKRLKIPGFRPGKAPTAVVERTVGWEAVKQEAVERLVPAMYLRVLAQQGIEAVGEPTFELEDFERDASFSFKVTITVKPEVDLGDYLSIRVEEEKTEIGDKEVDEVLEQVRHRNSELKETDRAVQLGDNLRAVLTMHHGEELLSGADEERNLDLDPGQLIPGLPEGIVGIKAGEERKFDITLPEDFSREELRGQKANVSIKVAKVNERILPELDDDLAKKDGNVQTVDAMREYYRAKLLEMSQQQDAEKYEGAVLEALADRVKVDIPDVMIERQIDRQLANLEMQLQRMGMPLQSYLEYSGNTMEKLRGQSRDDAVTKVRLELALDTLAKLERLEVDEAQVHREEKRVAEGQELTADQKRRLHQLTHLDLLRRAAAQRAMEIARSK